MKREILKPNQVEATLFVGVGGIGSKIIKKVADLCIDDDLSAVRFVTLDTDANDLELVEKGVKVTAIQTSSPRAVRDYLLDDQDAEEWFPGTDILDDKTVSEGAGQVRAISRLALNATIKNGNINKLYRQIDDLFLKNGKDKNHAIRVVIASTTAGGTGSGIAMLLGMLVRHYLSTNYPESACIIRGFLVLPGVMNGTVISNDSERYSLLRNGYATVKEINAFMMKGSGFFESDRRLHRYKGLCVTVPSVNGGKLRLSGLPFDFCFLLDRVDGIQRSMKGLGQYISNAARTLYEQNIGPMRRSAASKEDNVIKEFMDPDKHGRCRFGGAGSAILRYPYQSVVEYIAADKVQQLLFKKADDSAEGQESAIEGSWLKYDLRFEQDVAEYEKSPVSVEKEPKLYKKYVDYIEDGKKGDRFTEEIFFNHLRRIVNRAEPLESLSQLKDSADAYVENYFAQLAEATLHEAVLGKLGLEDAYELASTLEETVNTRQISHFLQAYNSISALEETVYDKHLDTYLSNFVQSVFGSTATIRHKDLDAYMLQKFLSNNGEAIHPNAERYLLYKLWAYLESVINGYSDDTDEYRQMVQNAKLGMGDYEVKSGLIDFEHEKDLKSMCDACDQLGNKDVPERQSCNTKLNEYFGLVDEHNKAYIAYKIASLALPYVKTLCTAFEEFYRTFTDKAVSLDRKKENIVDALKFTNGDCVVNLFSSAEMLDRLSDTLGSVGSHGSTEMFASIHDMVRENCDILLRKSYDPMNGEVLHDIFDEVMIGQCREEIETKYADRLDIDLLHALKLEFAIKCDVDISRAPEGEKEAIAKRAKDADSLKRYILGRFEFCRNLATPGICRRSFDEARDVNAMAYSVYTREGDGIRISDFLREEDASDTVSRYEVRFFRSLYAVMPTQLFQFCAPVEDGGDRPRVEIIDYSDKSGAGESFVQYQTYMENIGPDSRKNSVITPHIDSRWNSISVMPELDLDYQDQLMKHIHKAFFYGFLFDECIVMRTVSPRYDKDRVVYKYIDGRNGEKDLRVSNRTKCDRLYEVLDALYFDRAAVKSIHRTVEQRRARDEQRGVDFEMTEFGRKLHTFTLGRLLGKSELGDQPAETAASVFEIPYRYCYSIPARERDAAEIEVMIDAIVEAIRGEVVCFDKGDDVDAHVANLLIEQYNLFADMHSGDLTSDESVALTVRRRICDALEALDVSETLLESLR